MKRLRGLVGLVLVGSALLVATPSRADNVHGGPGLAFPTTHAPAVWADGAAYVFGGRRWSGFKGGYEGRPEIQKWTPSGPTSVVASLPVGNYAMAAVWVGNRALLFGGADDPTRIVAFTPSTNAVTTLAVTIPGGSANASAAYDGTRYVYIFDPSNGPKGGRVLRFDTQTETITTTANAQYPSHMDATAVWAGDRALIFGGVTPSGYYIPSIYSYDPLTDQFGWVGWMGYGRSGISAFWDGSRAFIFGGRDKLNVFYDIGSFTLAGGYERHVEPTWSNRYFLARAFAPVVWDGRYAYRLGGSCPYWAGCEWDGPGRGDPASRGVLVYDPYTARPPVSAEACATTNPNEVELTWSPPEEHVSPITGYNVYRDNVLLASPTNTGLKLTDTIFPGAVANYRIHAVNAWGDGLPWYSSPQRGPLTPENPPSISIRRFDVVADSSPLPDFYLYIQDHVTTQPTSPIIDVVTPSPPSDWGCQTWKINLYRKSTSEPEWKLVQVSDGIRVQASQRTVTFQDDGCLGECVYRAAIWSAQGEGPMSAESSVTTCFMRGSWDGPYDIDTIVPYESLPPETCHTGDAVGAGVPL